MTELNILLKLLDKIYIMLRAENYICHENLFNNCSYASKTGGGREVLMGGKFDLDGKGAVSMLWAVVKQSNNS